MRQPAPPPTERTSTDAPADASWRRTVAGGAGAVVAWANRRTWWLTLLLWLAGWWLLLPLWVVARTGASGTGPAGVAALLLGLLAVGTISGDAPDASAAADEQTTTDAATPDQGRVAAPGPASPPGTASSPSSSRATSPSPTPTPERTAVEPPPSASPRRDGAHVVVTDRVTNVVDGDTLDLADGRRVRIAIVDTPEVHGGAEPCGPEASGFTAAFVAGTAVAIHRPAGAPSTDGFGRTLGEVVRVADGASLNVALVRAGLGSVDERFVDEDPDLAERLRQAAASATPATCGGPPEPTSTPGPAPATGGSRAGGQQRHAGGTDGGYPCHPAYRQCLPQVTDLDCGGIGHQVELFGSSDPYDLDGNGDRIGCQSEQPWSMSGSYPYG